jgi:hypothetical protein
MLKSPMPDRRYEQVALLILTVLFIPTSLVGQPVNPGSPATTLDPYGNARARYVPRSTPGGFGPNDLSGAVTNPYLQDSRRSLRRQGLEPLSLPGIPGGNVSTRSGRASGAALGSRPLSPVFEKYGGFGSRSGLAYGDMSQVFQRKQALIQATGFSAPIRRAAQRNANFMAPKIPTFDQLPFLEDALNAADEHAPPLEARLDEQVKSAFDYSMTEAWALFREGNYRPAARRFESSGVLRADVLECSVGELFAYASIGSMKTASAALRQLVRRFQDPFELAAGLDMNSKYAQHSAGGDLAIQVRLFAAQDNKDAHGKALYVFTLAYLGRLEEAETQAAGLVKSFPESPYANWPALLRAVSAKPEPITTSP